MTDSADSGSDVLVEALQTTGSGAAEPETADDTVTADADDAGQPADGSGGQSRRRAEGTHDELVAEGDAAGDYLERLLDILDYDGDIDLDVEGERAVVSIVGGGDVDKLVGANGEVLNALQELTRLAAGLETGNRSRLMLDVAGYRQQRKLELSALGRETAEQVVESGRPARLGAMNPFERKIVHDAVAGVAGATSSSEGEEPRRRVVVSPAE